MLETLAAAAAQWTSLYANHAALRTAVVFAHVGGLVGAGGCAIAADRAMLFARPHDKAGRSLQLEALRSTHRVVMAGLVCIVISGLLLFAADVQTFLYSRVFWIKMALIGMLLVNGAILTSSERGASGGDIGSWNRLRATAAASLTLWFLITLAGVALTNVG